MLPRMMPLLWLVVAFGASAEPYVLSTADGLSLALRADGAVGSVRLGGSEVLDEARLAASGFSLIDMTDPSRSLERNLVPDPGFEAVGKPDSQWRLYRHKVLAKDSFTVDDATRHEGRQALRLEVSAADASSARFAYSGPSAVSPRIPVQPHTVYVLSFWLKAGQGAFGTSGALVAIRQNDAAGKECGRPYFPKFPILDDPTWKQMTFQFMTDAQASTVSLAVHPHEPPVTLWLDDFSLTPVTEPRGEPMLGKVEREPGGTLVHVGRAAGLVLQSRYQAQRDHIAIDAELSAADPGDRAVVLAFALPIQASGWTWWDDLETPKEVAGGERYGKLQAAGNGAMMSSYPFCALARTGIGGLSLANRMDEPRIFRLTCSAQSGLAMAYDLGLSEATRKFPRRARVHFVLYAHDPAWGFRSAADKYYRIVPQAFQARLQVHGNWFVGGVDDGRFPEDFEPGYMQAGAQPKPYLLNKRHGFLSERNSIPWFWFHTVVTSDPATQTMPRPGYEAALKKIEADTDAAENVGAYHAYYIRLRDMARACLNCGIHDAHGRLVSNAWQTWNRGKSWMEHWQLNTDPDLPSPSRAELWTRDEFEKEVERVGMLAGRVDGAHFDSLDGLRLNFRREHFAYVDIPLTFDYQTRRVAQLQAFHHVEFLRYVSSRLWPRGLSVSANQWGTWMLYAPWLDWLGAEAQISLGGGAEMRTLAYQKPVSYINEDEFWHKSPEHMRADVEHYMLYAAFPGRVGPEPSRHVARHYMPILAELSASGWEPLTHARASDPRLRVERFGRWNADNLHFTLYNPTDAELSASLVLDGHALGIAEGEACVVRELVENRLRAPRRQKSDLIVPLVVRPRRGLALRVARGDVSPYHRERAARALELLAAFVSDYKRFDGSHPLPWLVTRPGQPPVDPGRAAAIRDLLASSAAGLRKGASTEAWDALTRIEQAFREAAFFPPQDLQLAADKLTLVREHLSRAIAPGLAIGLAQEPQTIVPTAPSQLALRVTNATASPLPASRLRLLPPEGMRVTPQEPVALRSLGPGESADVAFGLEGESQKALFVWADLAAGDLRIGSRLHFLVSDSAVRMELGPERFAAGLDGQRAVVWLSNQLSAPLEGFARLSAEQGWRIMPERIPVTLQPGQRRRVEFAVSVPETAPDRAKMTAAFEAAQAKTGSQAVFTVRTAKGLPRVVCRRMAQPPRIDGALDDPCWAAAESVPLQLMRAPGEQKVKTLLRLACDDKHLYLTVWCWEPLMSALVTGRDPLWSNDDVEIFVEPFHRGQVQFIITADGRRNEPVSSPWRSAVARGPDWWSVEVSIPWAALGPDPPQPGDTWGLNVGRAARPHTEHHALSPRKGYKEDLADLLFAE